MNTKRILVMVLTLVMLVSAFTPTLSVFANELHEHDHEQDDKLNYVSLGDSMSNGIGMDGYDTTDNPGTDNDGRNGYLEVAPDAYPAQFTEWLKEYTGKDVNLTQLATSGARIEDVYYILNRGTENEFEPDAWTEHELLWNSDRWGDPKNENDAIFNDAVAEVHREAVKNADIISLATGNGNFGVFMMGRIMNLVGFGTPDDLADDVERYGYYTVENALALCEANEEITKLVMDTYNSALAYLEAMGLPMDLITRLADLLAYTTASYVISTMKTIDLIVEMNPDVTIIILPLINNGLDFNLDITLNGITKHFNAGDFLGALYTPLSAYLAAYTATKKITGEYKEATFLYAELPTDENGETIQVETYAQAFDTLYAPIKVLEDGTVDYPDSRKFCHHRFYEDIIDFVFPILGLSGSFTDTDIIAYETAQAQGTAAFAAYAAANPEKAQAIGYYLGIIDAVLYSIQSTPSINLDEISVAEGGEISIFSILGPIVGDLGTTVYEKVEANATAVAPRLAYELIAANITPVLEPYFSDAGFLSVFGADLEKYGDDSVEKTLEMISLALNNDSRFEFTNDLKTMKAALVDGYAQIESGLPALSMATVLSETLSAELTSVGLLEALLALYGRLKLAWGLSAHPSAVGHDTLTDSLINAYENEYTTMDETIENLKVIGEFVAENYDEAYKFGYNYVKENHYIELSVEAIEKAIAAIELAKNEVDSGVLGVTEELKGKIKAELDATINTLQELKDVLDYDRAKDVEGLVAAVFALEDDLYTHLGNIYAILEQAGIDVNQLVILPALNEAIRILSEEVLPQIIATAEAFANAVVEYVLAKLDALYTTVLGISKEVYDKIVETLVRLQLYVGDKIENALAPIVDAYFELLGTLTEIYGSVEEAMKVIGNVLGDVLSVIKENGEFIADTFKQIACAYAKLVKAFFESYDSIEEALKAAKDILANIIEVAGDAIADGIELYNTILNIIEYVYDDIENAVIVASQIFSYVYDFASENLTPEKLEKIYGDILAIVVEAYGATQDAFYVAGQIYEYFVNMVENAFEGNYELDSDSMYVSLGNAVYGKELAAMLGLGNKYQNFALNGNYLDAVADADLITIRLDNGEVLEFALSRIQNYGTPLDWDKHLNEEGKAALQSLLAALKEELVVSGKAAELTDTVKDIISEIAGVNQAALTPEFVADILVYVVESAIYSYAEFVDRFVTVLDNVYAVAPDATVVITSIQNPLDSVGLDLGEYGKALDLIMAGFNAQLVAAALANENTIFVDSLDAKDIYDALNVVCGHIYDGCTDNECNVCGHIREAAEEHTFDGCTDTVCNICGFEREAGEHKYLTCLSKKCTVCGYIRDEVGHKFTNYVYNNNAACGVNGTETAQCDNCMAKDEREVPGTALEHIWIDATCTAPRTCELCDAKEGDLLPHEFGDWKVVREPSHDTQGFQERTCIHCGFLEAMPIAKLEGLSTGAIVGISIGGVVGVGGIAAAIYFLIIKKKKV